MRKALNPAIEEELRGALTESEYARYEKEHQRPVLLEAIRGQVLAGKDVRSVIRGITLSPLDGARSVSAVLHGRLGTTVRPGTPVSWSARTPESAGEIARKTAEALDERTAALGERQLTQPEPWVMRHLGPPPRESKPGLQALLQADYARRRGPQAAGHRGCRARQPPRRRACVRRTRRMLPSRDGEARLNPGRLRRVTLAALSSQLLAPAPAVRGQAVRPGAPKVRP